MTIGTKRGDVHLLVVGDILDMFEKTEALTIPLQLAHEYVARDANHSDLIAPADHAHRVTWTTPGGTCTFTNDGCIFI